jgi:hypothetical protein
MRFGNRKGKYGAVKVEADGIVFDSKAECARYCELNLLQRAQRIQNLQVHVPFDLAVNGKKICVYIADFVYLEGCQPVVEDLKGVVTRVFSIKKKLFQALFPAYEFRIVRAR